TSSVTSLPSSSTGAAPRPRGRADLSFTCICPCPDPAHLIDLVRTPPALLYAIQRTGSTLDRFPFEEERHAHPPPPHSRHRRDGRHGCRSTRRLFVGRRGRVRRLRWW